MKTLYLHGYPETKFGGPFTLDVASPREAMMALAMQLEGFAEMIRDGAWHILRGPLEAGDDDDAERLDMELGGVEEIHLMPAITGAGNGGVFSIILGIAAIIAAPFTGGWSLGFYAAGAGLIVGGLIQMSIKMPGADTNTESTDDRASFLFNGPRNQSTQGVAIPRGYGRARVGSIVISAGLYAEDVTSG